MHSGRLHEIFSLSSEDAGRLRDRINAFNGLIRIFIHPYYERIRGNLLSRPPYPTAEVAKKKELHYVLSRMAKLDSDKTPPIFLFEEAAGIDRLRERFREELQNEIYVVPTQDGRPEPKVEDNPGLEKNPDISKRNWDAFRKVLKGVGVQRILIGGMYFEVDPTRTKEKFSDMRDPALAQCVGVAVNFLQDEFQIELSNLTVSEGESQKGRKEYLNYRNSQG